MTTFENIKTEELLRMLGGARGNEANFKQVMQNIIEEAKATPEYQEADSLAKAEATLIENLTTEIKARAVAEYNASGNKKPFALVMPTQSDFRRSDKGRNRTGAQASKAYDQAIRQRWRAMSLVIKAKLEAVTSKISTVEQEFFAWMVLPNGQTAGDAFLPQIEVAYETGNMPKLLPGVLDGEIK